MFFKRTFSFAAGSFETINDLCHRLNKFRSRGYIQTTTVLLYNPDLEIKKFLRTQFEFFLRVYVSHQSDCENSLQTLLLKPGVRTFEGGLLLQDA